MAGVKQFDEEEVLTRIMEVFWDKGYESTSIDDLVAATGLKRGSLYNAFGDKESMYLAAVDRYAERVGGPVRQWLSGDDPRQAILDCLLAHADRMANAGQPRGCLATNACLELSQRDDAVGRRVTEIWTKYESDIYQTLLRAQAAGQLSPGQDLRAISRFLHGTIRGMAAVHKATGDISAVTDMVDVAMRVFDVVSTAPPETV